MINPFFKIKGKIVLDWTLIEDPLVRRGLKVRLGFAELGYISNGNYKLFRADLFSSMNTSLCLCVHESYD